jgi:hypothetical protein
MEKKVSFRNDENNVLRYNSNSSNDDDDGYYVAGAKNFICVNHKFHEYAQTPIHSFAFVVQIEKGDFAEMKCKKCERESL